jgi:hypothetical protein
MILADSFFSGFREMCGVHHSRVGDWSKVKLKQVGKEMKKNKDSQREGGLIDSIEILPIL